MFATGETVGLVEWIIDDTYLVFLKWQARNFALTIWRIDTQQQETINATLLKSTDN